MKILFYLNNCLKFVLLCGKQGSVKVTFVTHANYVVPFGMVIKLTPIGTMYVVVMSSSWNFPARAERSWNFPA